MAAAASKEKLATIRRQLDTTPAATIADPSDPTYFLNRAAAYLKLSKYEDAERDCTTVLNLSNNKNVKAFFRRAQARVSLQKLGEAHNELVRVDELIVSKKGKAVCSLVLNSPCSAINFRRAASHAPRLVDSDAPAKTKPTERPLEPHQLAPPLHILLNPKPTACTSFKEAKQVRDEKSVGRVGGGIFRVSGNDPAHPQTRQSTTRGSTSAPSQPSQPNPTPAPDPSSPHALRVYARIGTSLPAFFRASLEPALLASLIPVLAAAAPPAAAREFMCALTRVPRFLSASERGAARAVWEAVVVGADDAEDADVAEAARAWGFAEH
ncbi:hypothetical protein H4582DRAFT_1903207 [Lactarius indigo]|nr:hypothetical protein H4582DRAFT_1903207 [Lactarius indigo]